MSRQAFLGSTRASKTCKQKEFDRVFLDALDDDLRQALGETAAEIILLHLERNNGLRMEEIPRNIEGFSSGLAELLDSGAHVLEGLTVNLLCSKLHLEIDKKLKLPFTEHVHRLRKKFEGWKGLTEGD